MRAYTSMQEGYAVRRRQPVEQVPPSAPFLTHLSTWFVLGSALVYASGFLTIQFFHDSYGLRGLNTEFFKIRYAHVGILFVATPLIVNVTFYALLFWRAHNRNKAPAWDSNTKFRTNLVGYLAWLRDVLEEPLNPFLIVAMFLVAASFYAVLIYYPPGTFDQAKYDLVATLIVAVVGQRSSTRFHSLKKRPNPEPPLPWFRRNWYALLRFFMTAALLYIFLRVFWFLKAELPTEFYGQEAWCVVLSLFFGSVVWRLSTPVHGASLGAMKTPRRVVAGVLLGLIYYLMVSFFAYGVYHYIPAGKGGGDYTHAGLVKLDFVESSENTLPAWLFANNPDHYLVLVDATDVSVFLANPEQALAEHHADGIGPPVWRIGRRYRPRVLELPRTSVQQITHLGTTYSQWFKANHSICSQEKPGTAANAKS